MDLASISPTQAWAALGECVHPGVIAAIATFALGKMQRPDAFLSQQIRFGSAFTGLVDGFYEGWSRTLQQEGAFLQYVLGSEKRRSWLALLRARHPSATFLHDSCCEAATLYAPDVDIWCCGWPCQTVSSENRCRTDREIREMLTLLRRALLYLQCRPRARMPRIVLFENVPGLAQVFHGEAYIEVNKYLASLPYIWYHDVLCPHDICASSTQRPRLFWLGILDTAHAHEPN